MIAFSGVSMRKLIVLIVLGLIGFYVAWPAWSGYKIAEAFRESDKGLLESKIDFPAVRQSLRPAIASEVATAVERAKRDAGPLGALIAGQLKDDVVARLAEGALTTVVTPDNLLRMARHGGNMREAFEKVMIEQIGKTAGGLPGGGAGDGGGVRLPGGIQLPGGLSQLPGLGRRQQAGNPPAETPKAEAPATSDKGEKPKFGLGNVKSFGFNGPLWFSVGVARDANAKDADVTAHLAFKDWDWKVVGVTPRPLQKQ